MNYKPHSMVGQKTVRIDDRTVICVSVDIPDDKARTDYIKKRETLSMVTESPRWKNPKKKVEEKIEELSDESPDLNLNDDEIDAIVEDDSDEEDPD